MQQRPSLEIIMVSYIAHKENKMCTHHEVLLPLFETGHCGGVAGSQLLVAEGLVFLVNIYLDRISPNTNTPKQQTMATNCS
jgi:hypothetical protein